MDKHSALEQLGRELIGEQLEQVNSLSHMEQKIRQILQQVGNVMLHLWLMWLTPRYNPPMLPCVYCNGEAQYKRCRKGTLRTMFGQVHYKRAYYLCGNCQRGHYPLDEQLALRPNAYSAEVERLAGLMGVQMPFAQGSALFAELTLVKLSDHSLAQATQGYGQTVVAQETVWEQIAQDETYVKTAPQTPLRLYGSLDGGRVLVRPDATDPQKWRELKVGAWFTARGQPPRQPDETWTIRAQDITYYTDIAEAETFGELVWATGVQRHAQHAHELIFLGDGARWIWDLVDLHFPHAIQIVDWFHACEYLMPVAKLAYSNEDRQKHWVAEVKTALWEGQLEQVIAACAVHRDGNRPDDPAQKAVTYYTNNQHRMDYPTYRAQGYQIGSGTIESGVKQIASQRMKVTGARWNLDNARLVAKARAAFLSGQWPALAVARSGVA